MRNVLAKIHKHAVSEERLSRNDQTDQQNLDSRRDHAVHAPQRTTDDVSKPPLFLSFPIAQQILFAKRLSMILRSGTPILKSMHMLSENERSSSVSYIYASLAAQISRGLTLSSGMKKFPRIFGEFASNIVAVGETTGTLSENLNYLAEELKKKQALKRKVVGALLYPGVIVLATTGITVLLTVYIFPKIAPIFDSFSTQLPLTTRILIAISGFLLSWGWFLLLGIIGLTIGIAVLMRIRQLRFGFERALLTIPILGTIIRYYNVVNICRTLGLLLQCNVGVVEAFEIVARCTPNPVFRKQMLTAALQVTRGQKVGYQFQRETRIFPAIVGQMIAVGEQTGNLSGSLNFCAEMYEEEITDLTKNLTNLLEPILMIVMGIIVGFVAVSIITPIYGITQNLTPHQ